MKRAKLILCFAAALSLSACFKPSEVTRASGPEIEFLTAGQIAAQAATAFDVQKINVTVPRTLTVSEANSYKPRADIVWRGDLLGNRYEQVEAILQDSFDRGVGSLSEGQAVEVDVVLSEFHALTERTRYSIGGTHAIKFSMTVRDAVSGAVIEPSRIVEANLRAFGGQEALRAESIGQTQKVRITDHLAKVMMFEMTRPRDFLPEQLPETALAHAVITE